MSLPAPECERVAAHRRSITVQAYWRSDGLWDIEGHLADCVPTILHALGLKHESLSFKYQGLDQRLTGVEPAKVIHDWFA